LKKKTNPKPLNGNVSRRMTRKNENEERAKKIK
jgi:hypothetical protein